MLSSSSNITSAVYPTPTGVFSTVILFPSTSTFVKSNFSNGSSTTVVTSTVSASAPSYCTVILSYTVEISLPNSTCSASVTTPPGATVPVSVVVPTAV